MSKRQKFSAEFREIAVEEVVGKDRRITDVAREMNVLPGTLGNWVGEHRKAHPEQEEPLSLSERAELAELRRENQELRTKAEFLGKAAAFFAKEYR
jgi:transposase-like protein